MKQFYALCIVGLFAVGFAGCAGCTSANPNPSQEDGGETDGGDGGDLQTTCKPLGDACGATDLCCQGACNAAGVCEKVTVSCFEAGAVCADNTDCCTNRCEAGHCSANQCVDNGAACTDNAQCCTGNCSGGTCAQVNAGECRVQGQACTTGSECCSTNCQGGTCVAAYSCRAPNDLCYKDTDCCSSLCSQNDGKPGFCRAPSGGCTQDGVPCQNSSNCCTRVCADPGTGATVCLPASGCKMTGAPCPDEQSCCGGGTNPNGSVNCVKAVATDVYGRCDNGSACNPVGNICGAKFPTPDGGTFSVNAPQSCCDGKTAACKLDSSGIPRCFGGGSTQCPTGYTGEAPCCIALGEVCQFKDQCCNGAPCVPDGQGVLRCTASSCTPLGEACEPGASACCSGECLANEVGFSCRLPTTGTDAGSCKSNGATCSNGSECCSTVCNNGVCEVPNVCQPKDGICTTSADCCTGLGCVVPSGSTSGTCQGSTCSNAGQSCSPSNPCCTGFNCLKDGTVQPCDGTTSCTCNVVIG